GERGRSEGADGDRAPGERGEEAVRAGAARGREGRGEGRVRRDEDRGLERFFVWGRSRRYDGRRRHVRRGVHRRLASRPPPPRGAGLRVRLRGAVDGKTWRVRRPADARGSASPRRRPSLNYLREQS